MNQKSNALIEKLKTFYISLRTIGFKHAYLTYDDNLFIKTLLINHVVISYEVTIHKKPCGFTLVFIFNGRITYRKEDKSIPVFTKILNDFLEWLYENHPELLTN